VPFRRPSSLPPVAAALPITALAFLVGAAPAGPGWDPEPLVLWPGVTGPESAAHWRPLGVHPDAPSCKAARRDALQAAWKGLREVGVLELIPVGSTGFTRVDPRTLETYTFGFACRPGPAPTAPSP
jgi:hypothetical protein